MNQDTRQCFFRRDPNGQLQGELAYTLLKTHHLIVIDHLMIDPALPSQQKNQLTDALFSDLIADAQKRQWLIWTLGPEAILFFKKHPELKKICFNPRQQRETID